MLSRKIFFSMCCHCGRRKNCIVRCRTINECGIKYFNWWNFMCRIICGVNQISLTTFHLNNSNLSNGSFSIIMTYIYMQTILLNDQHGHWNDTIWWYNSFDFGVIIAATTNLFWTPARHVCTCTKHCNNFVWISRNKTYLKHTQAYFERAKMNANGYTLPLKLTMDKLLSTTRSSNFS